MARWKPSFLEAEDAAVRRLIAAHPDEYHHLLDEAKAELPVEPCESCAYLGATALELADLLGHDQQGHRVHQALWSEQIRSVDDVLRVLEGDLGLYYLHGWGLGKRGLGRIHDRVRRLEGARADRSAHCTAPRRRGRPHRRDTKAQVTGLTAQPPPARAGSTRSWPPSPGSGIRTAQRPVGGSGTRMRVTASRALSARRRARNTA